MAEQANADVTLESIDLSGGKASGELGAQTPEVEIPEEEELELEGEQLETEQPEGEDLEGDIKTMEDLAASLGVESSQLYDLNIPMQNMDPVSLSELKDVYQAHKNQNSDFESQKLAFDREKANFNAQQANSQSFQKETNEAVQQADSEIAQIESAFNQIDWARFESENPAEAVLQRQKFNEAYAQASNNKQQVVSSVEQKQLQARQEFMLGQKQQVNEMIPGWKDSKVYEADRVEMRSFLNGYGFSENEVSNISEARLVKFVYDFMSLKRGMDKVQPIKKSLKKVAPLKSGALNLKKVTNAQKRDKIVAAGSGSSDSRVQRDAVSELLRNL